MGVISTADAQPVTVEPPTPTAAPTATALAVAVAAPASQATTPHAQAPPSGRTAAQAPNWLAYGVIVLALFLVLFLGLWLASRGRPAQS
jgi:hypothetical protein